MKYEGDIKDLILFSEEIDILYYISFNDKCYSLNNKIFFKTYNKAKANLYKHIYYNFCQGHYWHKNKNNTFSKEMGWERNSGNVGQTEREFVKFAHELTDELLKEKIFDIKVWELQN